MTASELAKKLHHRVDECVERFDPTTWFDLWHEHPDWDAEGNESDEHRSIVASETMRLLQLLEAKLSSRSDSIQIFASFAFSATEQAAVYVHSSNPNGTQYPHTFGNFSLAVALPSRLASQVPEGRYSTLAGSWKKMSGLLFTGPKSPNNFLQPTGSPLCGLSSAELKR